MTSATRTGMMILGAVGLVVIGLAAAGAMIDAANSNIDRTSGCAVGNSPAAEVVVLIDVSDSIPSPVQAEVREWFRQFVEADIVDGTRVTLWTLGGDKSGTLQRRFCRCRPARHINALIGNPSMAAALSDSIFDQPFAAALAAVPKVRGAETTPLLESLREVCRQPEFARTGVARRVVVVSDLEQNTPRLSFYHTRPNFAAVRAAGVLTPLWADLRTAQVDVLYIPRGRAALDLDGGLEDFFRAYSNACGAAAVRIRRV